MRCTNATAVLGELGMAGLVAVLKQCHEAALRDAVPESLGTCQRVGISRNVVFSVMAAL